MTSTEATENGSGPARVTSRPTVGADERKCAVGQRARPAAAAGRPRTSAAGHSADQRKPRQEPESAHTGTAQLQIRSRAQGAAWAESAVCRTTGPSGANLAVAQCRQRVLHQISEAVCSAWPSAVRGALTPSRRTCGRPSGLPWCIAPSARRRRRRSSARRTRLQATGAPSSGRCDVGRCRREVGRSHRRVAKEPDMRVGVGGHGAAAADARAYRLEQPTLKRGRGFSTPQVTLRARFVQPACGIPTPARPTGWAPTQTRGRPASKGRRTLAISHRAAAHPARPSRRSA